MVALRRRRLQEAVEEVSRRVSEECGRSTSLEEFEKCVDKVVEEVS